MQVDIKYNTDYQITDDGRVWSKKRKIFMKPFITQGYAYIKFRVNGVKKSFRIHRLVAEAFIPNPENKPVVDHINTIKTDNRMVNLRWSTRPENMNNPITVDKMCNSQKNRKDKSRQVCQYTLDGKLVKVWPSIRECDRNGFDRSSVRLCCYNEYYEAKNVYNGFIWRFAS